MNQEIMLHPSLGVFVILTLMTFFGSLKFGFSAQWFLVSFSGIISLTIGTVLAGFSNKNIKFPLIFSEITLFIVIFFSFLKIAGYSSFLISSLCLIVANTSPLLVRIKKIRTPIYSILIFVLGVFMVVYSYLKILNIAELRALSNIPLEGAFGMFLIFISYPSIFSWLSKFNSFYVASFSVVSILLMLLHGFRADAILIILSMFLLIWKRRRNLSYLILMLILLLYIIIDIMRVNLAVSALERPIFRLITTYYYSKELTSAFFRLIPIEPFWLTSIPLHPSQTIGRGIFGKNFGITPTIFVGMLMDLGFIGMIILSLLLGLATGCSYKRFVRGEDEFSYPIIWPIIITRTEIGLTQLDLALIFGSIVFSLLFSMDHVQIPRFHQMFLRH
jgi:hypothetical protein